MARIKLKEFMEGNRRNVDCNGRRWTIYKNSYQSVPDELIKFFNPEQYEILIEQSIAITDEEIKKIKEEVKTEIKKKNPVLEVKPKPKSNLKLKSK